MKPKIVFHNIENKNWTSNWLHPLGNPDLRDNNFSLSIRSWTMKNSDLLPSKPSVLVWQHNAQMLLNPWANSVITSPLQPGSCTDRKENCYIPLTTCPSLLEIGFKTGDRLMNRKLSWDINQIIYTFIYSSLYIKICWVWALYAKLLAEETT